MKTGPLRLFLELRPVGHLGKWQIKVTAGCRRCSGQGSQRTVDQSFHFPTQRLPVLFGQGQTTARLRPDIGPATDRRQRDGRRVTFFNFFVGMTGPVPTDLVAAADRGAMTGVVGPDHDWRTVGIARYHYRQAMVDRAIGLESKPAPGSVGQDPSISPKRESPLSPAQGRRLPGRQSPFGGFGHLFYQPLGVSIGTGRLLGRHPRAPNDRRVTIQGRCVVRVSAGDHNLFRCQLVGGGQLPLNDFGYLGRYPTVVDRYQNDGFLLADRQCAGPEAGVDPLVLTRPTSVTGQQRRVRRGDVELGSADLDSLTPRARCDQQDQQQCKDLDTHDDGDSQFGWMTALCLVPTHPGGLRDNYIL